MTMSNSGSFQRFCRLFWPKWLLLVLIGRYCVSFRVKTGRIRPTALSKGQFEFDAFPVSNYRRRRRTAALCDSINGHDSSLSATDATLLNRSPNRVDHLDRFSQDVTKILKEIKSADLDQDIPDVFRRKRLTFTSYWTKTEWALYSSRFRFIRYIRGFPTSRLLRRILPQLSVLLAWSIIACLITKVFDRINIDLTSLSLVSTFVAALQTLRSNQGLNRLTEARIAMGRAVLLTRDTALLFSTYVYPKDKQLGLLAARHLALLPWLLKAHFRDADEPEVLHTMLPFSSDAAFIRRQRKKPVAIIARLRQIMFDMSERKLISTTEHRLIEDNLRGLDDVIMVGERIRSTPTPPVYVAHSTRLMMFYLFFLPMALLGTHLNGLAQVSVTTAVGFALLGLDEISVLFEEPYRLMPLYQIAKVSMLDVSDAFILQAPPLRPGEKEEEVMIEGRMPYWPTSVNGI